MPDLDLAGRIERELPGALKARHRDALWMIRHGLEPR